MGSTLNIVTIYTSKDIGAIQPVLDHLKSLQQDHNLNISDNNPILEGQQWKPKSESFLQETDIFLLLLSSSFMYSEFVSQLEFKLLIDSYKAGDSRVIPILLEDCPWDTEFLSEDYKFSFNELEVLPEQQKPIKNWESSADAYDNIRANIGAIISTKTGIPIQQEEQKVEEVEVLPEVKEVIRIEEVAPTIIVEDQIAISFDEEKVEEKRVENEIDLERKAKEEQRLLKEAEAKRIAADAEKLRAEAETKQKIDEHRLKGEAEAKKIANERKLKADAEVKRRAEEEQRRLDKERKQQTRNAENARRKQQKQNLEAKSKTKVVDKTNEQEGSSKKKLLVGALIAIIAIIGIWAFSGTNKSPDELIPAVINTPEVDQSKPKPTEEVNLEPVQQEVSQPKRTVGDQFKGGIIFSIDNANKNGIVVHIDDAGPMPWQQAIKIHEQLGEGWRLPTFIELQLMRKNVGQGVSNTAEFSNGLYWSSTAFDEHQAQLLRFRDGNTSYHYNRNIDTRSHKVRAVLDFSW